MAKNTICVWYDKDAEAAARFYAETFPDSAVGVLQWRAPGDYPSGKKGDVLVVEFKVAGVSCIGLNGGPAFKHTEATHLVIATEDQAETGTPGGTPSSAMAARRVRAAGARTSGACRGKSRRAC